MSRRRSRWSGRGSVSPTSSQRRSCCKSSSPCSTLFRAAAAVERALTVELARKRRKKLQSWAARAATDAAQKDQSAQATLERLRSTPEADTAERDRLARLEVERFHAEGRALPDELDEAIVFA